MLEDQVAELERQRFAFLKEVYDRSGGDSTLDFPAKDIGRKLGFDETLNEKIYQYLKAEDLLEYRGMGPQVAITHEGIKKIELASKQPESGTEHFPANVNIVQPSSESKPHWLVEHAVKVLIGALIVGALAWTGANYEWLWDQTRCTFSTDRLADGC